MAPAIAPGTVTPMDLLMDMPPRPQRDRAADGAVVATDLTRHFGAKQAVVHALRGVSLTVPTGQFVAIMGPSGSGKSTLMHCLAGLDRPTSGSVRIGPNEVTAMDEKALTRLRRHDVGFVFQAFNLLPTLSAEENVLLPLRLAGRDPDRAWLETVLERVGLTDRRGHRPDELSGGQQQRVAVARALVSAPTVLFADEPTGNLDSVAGGEVLGLLGEAARTFDQTIVMVTHDAHAAEQADRVVFLADGLVAGDLVDPSVDEILTSMREVAR